MATENVKVVKIDTNAAQTSVKDLRNELKELRTTLLNTEQGTKEYNDALEQAANIQHTLKEQMEEVNASAMDFGQIVGNVVNVTGGMVAGFQAAQATMNLFGVENEAVIKSLEKMQNLMAITQAIPAIDEGIKAFDRLSDKILSVVNRLTEKTVAEEVDTVATKANTTAMEANATATNVATKATNKWKKALVSTGLGAILLALGYLVTNFEEISKWLDKVTGQTDFLGNLSDKVIGGLNAGWAALVQSIKAIGSAISTYITAPFKSVWAAIQAYTSTKGGFADKLKAAGSAMKNTFVDDWKDVGNDFKEIGTAATNAYYDGVKSANEKRTAETKEAREERERKEKEAAEKLAKEIADIRARYEKLSEEMSLYSKTELEKKLHELDKAYKSEEKLLEDAHKKGIISKKEYEDALLKLKEHYAELEAQAVTNAEKEEQNKRISDSIKESETSYKLEQAQLEKKYKEGLISEEEFNEEKKKLTKSYVESYVANLQNMLDTEKGLTKEQILDLTNRINEARGLLENNDKNKDTESEEEKKLKAIKEGVNELSSLMNSVSENPAWGNMVTTLMTIGDIFVDLKKKQKEFGADSTEYAKAATNAYMQVAAVGFNAMGQMFQGIADEQDTSNKKGFETAKKMQIASATMTTLSSILQALAAGNSMASQMGLAAPVGWAMGAAMATMVGTLGAVNISKIAKQKFDVNSTASSVAATPNIGAVNSVIAPVQYTQDVQGASIEGAIRDTKVYVTETDISNTQNKVSVTENEARF